MNNENGFPAKSTVLNLLNLDIPILVLLWYNKLNFSKQKQFIHAEHNIRPTIPRRNSIQILQNCSGYGDLIERQNPFSC